MPAHSARRQGPSIPLLFLMFMALVVLGGVGTVAGLHMAGLVELPFLAKAMPSRVGKVRVTLTARPIPAYKLIRRDDLIDPQTGAWVETWVDEEIVRTHKILAEPTKLIGRVMNYEKGPLFSITENDLLPVGTRPGLVAGIPPGKRSMIVEVAKVAGLHALQMGDRFDIVATMPIDKHHAPPARNMRGPDSLQSAEPEVRVIVDDGIIVSPVRLRTALGTATSLTKGQRTSAKSVEEVVIAVDPAEIPELTAAMSREASITAVARSGHPDDAQVESVTPDSKPVPPPTAIETVVGGKRETIFFPTINDAPASDQPSNIEKQQSPRLEPNSHRPLPVAAPRVQTRQTRVIQPGMRSADTLLGSRRNSASFTDRPADRVLP